MRGNPFSSSLGYIYAIPTSRTKMRVEYADTILLMVGTLALAKFLGLDPSTRMLSQGEVTEFLSSAKADGFPFVNGRCQDSKANAVNAARLWDLASARCPVSTPISTPARTAPVRPGDPWLRTE